MSSIITSTSSPIHHLACHAEATLAINSPKTTKHAYLLHIVTILAALAGAVALGIMKIKSRNTSLL